MTKLAELEQRVEKAIDAEIHRKDFGLRVIIFFKCVKAALLAGLSVLAFVFAYHDIHAYALDLVNWLGIDPAGRRMTRWLAKIAGLTPHEIQIIGVGAAAMSVVMLVEAWGLHKRRVWAEWLTIIVTSLLIPVEIYELVHRASLGKVLALVINVAVVIYLARHKGLFRRKHDPAPPPDQG